MTHRTCIGIDVGWSEKRPSSGLAVRGGALPLPGRVIEYAGGVRASAVGHRQLLAALDEWRSTHSSELATAAIVIDGPLAPEGVPRINRLVDEACGSGDFRGRCQPVPIEAPFSPAYLKATDETLAALGRPRHWLQGEVPGDLFIAETDPTVALALIMPRIPVSRLASRNRPLEFQDKLVYAKSDWYWRHGADRQVSAILESNLAGETDHERCAALLCLSLAELVLSGQVVTLGDANGVYVVPVDLDATWSRSLRGVVWHGKPLFRDHMHHCSKYWRDEPALELFEAAEPEPAPDVSEKGDEQVLILSDSGGVWSKHNAWLANLEPPVFLRSLDSKDCPTIILQHADRHAEGGQWMIAPTALRIAQLHGFEGILSRDRSVQLRVALLSRPQL